MAEYESDGNESIDTDRAAAAVRDVRALTQQLTVRDDIDRARHAEDLFIVASHDGGSYLVDLREGVCECADNTYRGVRCKHLRRVDFATSERAIPATVDAEDIDLSLGEHVDDQGTVEEPDRKRVDGDNAGSNHRD